MKLDNFEKITKLKKSSNSLMSFYERFKQETNKNSCDKYGCGFNKDDRFINFKVSISFNSWTGYYGNSGCTTFGLYFPDEFKSYFVDAINSMQREIFNEMARKMLSDANEISKKAQKEIDQMQKLLSDVKAGEHEELTK